MGKKRNLVVIGTCACLSACLISILPVHAAQGQTEDPGEGRLSGKYISSDFYETDDRGIMPFSLDTSSYIHASKFEGRTILNGIDVSQFQNQNGEIDWDKVAADGVDFVMVRVGLRGYGEAGNIVADAYGEENIQGALDAGLQVGIYFFSQAITEEEARQEADYLVNIADHYNDDIELPLAIDYEYVSDGNDGHIGRLFQANLTDQERTDICRAFCERIDQQGYEPMLYGNKTMLTEELDADQISEDYEVWFAGYGTQATYNGDYNFWQYTNVGSVDGIQKNVDQDFWYTNPEELRKIDGTLYYFKNGQRQSDFKGLVKYEGSWYYIQNGSWQKNYEGIVQNDGNYYYVKNGKVQDNVSGLIKIAGTWYYISNGKWQNSYNGLVKHTTGSWYYVENGKMKSITGLAKHVSGTWYYVENGRWNSGITGLVKHTSGSWYYVEGGRMKQTTGLVKHTSGSWYYVESGRMKKVTTLVKHNGGWFYVADGRWMSSWKGLVHYGSNNYYVKDGRWQKSFSGKVTLNGVKYTIKNGLKV